MSRLLDARAELLAALEAGGLATATGPQFAAPCVIVEPGDPWITQGAPLPGRSSRWKLTIVAGRADTGAALEALADHVDRVDTALLAIAGVQLPSWARPADIILEGVPYGVAVATIAVGLG